MTRDEVPAEALALIDRFVDEIITAEDLRRLETILRGNLKAQLFFMRYSLLHVNLDIEARMQPAIDAFRQRPGACAAPPERAAGATTAKLIQQRASSWPPVWGQRQKLMAICLSAAMILVAAVGWRAFSRRSDTARTVPQSQPISPQVAPLHAAGLRFETTETRTISLGDAGTMMVQGPAELEFLGPLRARLHRGRVRVRVSPEHGRGFVVETPHAHVTDLGTEFGIDVANDTATGVVVFEGSVDVTIPSGKDAAQLQIEHLVEGDGVVVRETGRLDRLMTIVTSETGTFAQPGEPRRDGTTPLIADVWDDVGVCDSKKLYEIVPRGLREDARAYADRPTHEWNGRNALGLPPYLVGADYVKTFNDYKLLQDMRIYVLLSRPARLFVFMDRRVAPPAWLRRDFRETDDSIGLDEGPFFYISRGPKRAKSHLGVGPGQSIDRRYFVWEQIVEKAGVVTLGGNAGPSKESGMYGIAAAELDRAAPMPEP